MGIFEVIRPIVHWLLQPTYAGFPGWLWRAWDGDDVWIATAPSAGRCWRGAEGRLADLTDPARHPLWTDGGAGILSALVGRTDGGDDILSDGAGRVVSAAMASYLLWSCLAAPGGWWRRR